jgi:hypothetical protein
MGEVTGEKHVAVPSKERKGEVDLERALEGDRYPKDWWKGCKVPFRARGERGREMTRERNAGIEVSCFGRGMEGGQTLGCIHAYM